jgi:ABC-type transport system substrate-binding protein
VRRSFCVAAPFAAGAPAASRARRRWGPFVIAAAAFFGALACAAPEPRPVDAPLRIAVRSSRATRALSSLSYKGGFEPKTLVYENLVTRDEEGRIAPGLAQSWRFEKGGTECVFELRPNARFHDGSSVTAEAVRQHFLRWVGLPEHDWLPSNRHIVDVVAEGSHTLRVRMARPMALLGELCAINPCAVRAPATVDFEGEFVEPVGSGPFEWRGISPDGSVLHYSLRARPGLDGLPQSRIDLVRFVNEPADAPIDELLAGRIDAVFDGWRERIPRRRIAALRVDPRVKVVESLGSSVVWLSFKTESGPCASETLRKQIRAALDRDELVRVAESGHADPCDTLMSPTVRPWPRGGSVARPSPLPKKNDVPRLRLLVRLDSEQQGPLAEELIDQLKAANLQVVRVALRGEAYSQAVESGAFEMRLERSWGVPYDPDLTLYNRFGPPLPHIAAANPPLWGKDPAMTELVVQLSRQTDELERARLYSLLQQRVDSSAVVIPLYVPRRFAVVRADLPLPRLDHDLYRIDATSIAPATVVRQP